MRAPMIVALALLAACSKPPSEPAKVSAVVLGSRINDDKTVSSMQETFAPSSTVYASIAVEGTGSASLAARWTLADGTLLAEQTQPIDVHGPTHFEFHAKPESGWPIGRHKVVFTLDGGAGRTREFEVR